MKLSKTEKPALILIDIQKGFDDLEYWGGERNNLDAEKNAFVLLEFWREKEWPIFHVKHCSTFPFSKLAEGQLGNEFKDIVKPLESEIVIKKNVHSAFIGTNLKAQLDFLKIQHLIIIGFTTDHCVSTTARMAGNYGYQTYVVSDATATFNKTGIDGKHYSAKTMHETALASLHEEFATILSTENLISKIKHIH